MELQLTPDPEVKGLSNTKKKSPPKKVEATYKENKLVCPICEKQDYIYIKSYDIGKEKGKFMFKLICNKCNVKFENETTL